MSGEQKSSKLLEVGEPTIAALGGTLRSTCRLGLKARHVMAKERKGAPPQGHGFWIFIACCAIGAIALVALLLGGEIQGERVGPNIEHQSRR
jgi:hypothetical protein